MSKTMSSFCELIIVENFCCINRNFLIESQLKRKIYNYISILIPILLISILIYDSIAVSDMSLRAFQMVLIFETVDLALIARFRRNSFEAIARWDRKCGLNDAYFEDIKRKATVVARISIASAIIDAVGLYLLETRLAVIVVLVIFFSAHDTELAFLTLLMDCMNLRLSTLKDQHPIAGSRIYRHVLIVTSHINEEFTPRVMVMLGVTVITTVVYSFFIFLGDPGMMWKISAYLFWREMKSLHSLWLACSAAAKTEEICRRLAFHLASRLALDLSISKENNSKLHKTVRRWYTTVLSIRPCYVSGSVVNISMGVPLILIDISINYMIIIVQIYIAYK